MKVAARSLPTLRRGRAASRPATWFDGVPDALREGLPARLRTLLAALGRPVESDDPQLLSRSLGVALSSGRADEMWLALAVLTATLPAHEVVRRAVRATRLDGALPALAIELRLAVADYAAVSDLGGCTVEVVTDQVIVDVNNTARTDFATGIQRVARETVGRWVRDHDLVLVGWHRSRPALRRLLPREVQHALHGGKVTETDEQDMPSVLVPWRCHYVLPELIAELDRVGGLHGLFRYSGNVAGVIGFDCVPLTVPETVQSEPVVNGFAALLAALTHADRVATISVGAAGEYLGWRKMLAGAGWAGPQIVAVPLAVDTGQPNAEALEQARLDLIVAGLPMLLIVGSHEPRKNHLAVLHAAELLWRRGIRFSLLFVGGNSWNSERFTERVKQLRAGNRPIDLISAAPDEQLWAAYRLARASVFPSLNEGFGLPVAESLASGTPVITSDFGSMREIAAHGGAILIDPRDDRELAEAMRVLVTDDDVHGALSRQASERPIRTWDEYAADTWNYLVDGVAPAQPAT